MAWVESFQLFDRKYREKFAKINVELLSGIAYSHHSMVHLRVACDFMNLLFATDEVSDLLGGEETEILVRDIIYAIK